LTVQPVGSSFTGAVTLGCTTGLPVQAQCLFSPSTAVTPGNSAIDVVMNISTTPASGSSLRRPAGHPAIWLVTAVLLPGILIVPVAAGRRRSGRMRGLLVLLVSIFLNLSMLSCAGVSSGGSGTTTTTTINPATYQVTVTGSSPGAPADAGHSVVVTLVVD
jgi:hypothetical protein